MTRLVFTNASVLDAEAGALSADQTVIVEDERIVEVGGRGASFGSADRVVDAHGRVLMPGLIDGHVHVVAAHADLGHIEEWSPLSLSARASAIMRDAAGADFGLARAVDEGYIEGPRLIFGAHHIKLMLSGGVASPTDRVDSTQFSLEQIRAAVEEATAANIYVLGHAYTARANQRGLACGVRSIEHGNLMDDSAPAQFIAHDAWQSREFKIRSEVQSAAAVIRAATTSAARLLRMEGEVGVVKPGAYADVLLLDGSPLEDIDVLAEPDAHLEMVVKAGRIYRDCT